jgi:methylglutamate dehydrogenase subunit D
VSSPLLTSRSALDRVLAPGRFGAEVDAPGVFIAERTGLALASVMARKGKAGAVSAHAKQIFGIDLPLTPRRVADGPIHFVWAGPDRWLAESWTETPHTFERDLREAFMSLASVTSQSDGRSIIRLGGPKAREVLAKGMSLDLDPRVFGPGDAALTVAAHISVHFWQLDATPTYDFAVFRSFAASFCEWLLDASAEFGAVLESAAAV